MRELIFGFHAIEEALKSPKAGSTLYIVKGESRAKKIEMLAISTGKVVIKKVNKEDLNKIAPEKEHRGAILDLGSSSKAGARGLKSITTKDFLDSLKDNESATVLVLDGITDPHNLGAILRSADQFGVSMVIIPQRRSASMNETVLRISSGAARYVPICKAVNLSREIDLLKDNGFWIYGADMNGSSSYNTSFEKRTVIVMGNEGAGISRIIREKCDHIISIPMVGHIDSLNVSVATGILLYEIKRKGKV